MRYRNRNHEHHNRAGLTLVEMLIALALSIFIMAILSEAFVKGLEVFGQYKALADLDQRLRTVANILRRDLQAPHFEGNKKLSECTASGKAMPSIDGLPATPLNATQVALLQRQLAPYRFVSPNEGFFSVEEWANRPGNPARTTMYFEGADSSNRISYRDQYDVLHFTSRLEGNEPDKYFYGKTRQFGPLDGAGRYQSRYDNAPDNKLYTSQAAEMLYFLGADDTANLPGVTLPGGPVLTFNLYRQNWLLVPTSFSASAGPIPPFDDYTANQALYAIQNDVSAFNNGGNFYYNNMSDVQHRRRRVGTNPWINGNPPVLVPRSPKVQNTGAPVLPEGSDILLTNVISFDVKVYDPFAYKIPYGTGGGRATGRGAYVDIGDVYNNVVDVNGNVVNPAPTAAGEPGELLNPVFGNNVNVNAIDFFDTGTERWDGTIGSDVFSKRESPATHPFPFNSIQITIRVFEPKSRQTRQITIIQDM